MSDSQISFACDMGALTPEERSAHLLTLRTLFGSVEAVEELSQGYAFRLPAGDSTTKLVTRFIEDERRCCPFFGFGVREMPDGRHVWLDLTGPDGVKPFILAEVGSRLPPEIISALRIVHDR